MISKLAANKQLRSLAAVLVLVITVLAFGWYFHSHPQALDQLRHISISTVIILMLLYAAFSGALMFILYYSLVLCDAILPLKENALLTIYSSIINFFGPLQSGPGFRALYLKQKHQVKFKDFIKASLIYYGFFAIISAGFLFGPSVAWWLSVPALLAVGGVCAAVIRLKHISLANYKQGALIKLFLATLLQLTIVAIIYFVELRAVNSQVAFRQAVVYSGAANFALFVSLTPGAIGFRESFLLLAHHLHHVSNSVVLTASLLDRGIYIFFLGLLFLVALSVHAKDRLQAPRT